MVGAVVGPAPVARASRVGHVVRRAGFVPDERMAKIIEARMKVRRGRIGWLRLKLAFHLQMLLPGSWLAQPNASSFRRVAIDKGT